MRLREQNEILEDPEVSDYIQTLGLRLSSQAPDSDRQFHYYVVREGDINAEALPGAFVVGQLRHHPGRGQ